MVRLGCPSDISKYYMADGDLAFVLQQNGCHPEWRDGSCLYFKINNKLKKALDKLGMEL